MQFCALVFTMVACVCFTTASHQGGKGCGVYDAKFYLCCDGRLIPKREGYSGCCGTVAYNPTFNICCGGVLNHRLGGYSGCCGTVAYDPTFNICCNGHLYHRGSHTCNHLK